MDSSTERLLVPYDEARHLLGDIGRTKFHQLIDQKKLTRVRVGRRGFIVAESIWQYVASLRETATACASRD
jgi:hypothetical protein